MYGDRRQSGELKKDYKNYVLMKGSGNLWQITSKNNPYLRETNLVKKTSTYKDIKVK